MTTPPESTDPILSVRHRQLVNAIRRLREARGVNQAAVADAVGISRQRYGRLENGAKFKAGELESILDWLGCDQADRLALLDLAKNINVRGLWETFGGVLSPALAEIESAAVNIRSYQTLVIPGPLQTREYATALAALGQPEDEERQLQIVLSRIARRRRLVGVGGPEFHTVIAEPVLHSPIGGEDVLRDQRAALVAAAEHPNVSIRVLLQSSWQHPGHEGSFVIFGFGGPSSLDVAYEEGAGGSSIYLEAIDQVTRCSVNFDRISKVALSEQDSVRLIEEL